MVAPIKVNGVELAHREGDRYVPATPLCKAAGKKWNDYSRLKETKAFIEALASKTGIPAFELVQVKRGRHDGGAWIHPKVVIHFAMWVSGEFAVLVTDWAERLLAGETVTLTDEERSKAIKAAKAGIAAWAT